jgi:hypothetical protein
MRSSWRFSAGAPALDRARAVRLTEGLRANDPRTALLVRLIETALARLSATGAGHPPAREAAPGEAAMLARLAPGRAAAHAWAGLHESLGARARHGLAVNLDPSALILDMVLTINETASRLARRAERPMTAPPRITDSHTHLDFPDFAGEVDAVVRARRRRACTGW